MTPTPETLELIKQEISYVRELKEPGMAFEEFSGEYARYMAQKDIDKDALLAAGMPPELMEKYDGYDYVLTHEHALRLVAEGAISPALLEFENGFPKCILYRRVLRSTLEFMMDEESGDAIKKAYKKIMKGTGTLAALHDIISFATLIEQNLELAAGIKPNGMPITQEYLDLVQEDTYKMQKLLAKIETSTPERSIHVETQKRLITLCIKAEAKLKQYAKAAFVTKEEYYKENYSNHVFRERYRNNVRDAAREAQATEDAANAQESSAIDF